MKISDYIVEYFISRGITDVFGYPGGMVIHLMNSFRKYGRDITAHVNYHEQAAAFAACGYAQTSGKIGIAYATSGPGATNLLTGICNAYFDSIPCVFITGQVNTFESKGERCIRQCGFQETNIITIVKDVTKYAAYVEDPLKIRYYLDRAFAEATEGRMGPALLDIPMNVFRSEIDAHALAGYDGTDNQAADIANMESVFTDELNRAFQKAARPCLLLGNGIKISQTQSIAKNVADRLRIPVVTSMIAFDAIAGSEYSFGFIGAYGSREANFIVAKCDLLISIGSRLDVRQVGAKRANFAPDAKLIRVDIDEGEMSNRVHDDEIQVKLSAEIALAILADIKIDKDYSKWLQTCGAIRRELFGHDERTPNLLVKKLSMGVAEDSIITTDVGQNQVWVAQSFVLKALQKVLFSGGHGAMGYSLPAAIGAYFGSGKKPVVCFCGDGGFQMNIQELQFVKRENLPITIILLNNKSLGMIRHFQEMYFDGKYYQTTLNGGYTTPDFSKIAEAYGIRHVKIETLEDADACRPIQPEGPLFIEVIINEDTYVFPKLEFGKPNQDQEPLLSRDTFERLMRLGMDEDAE